MLGMYFVLEYFRAGSLELRTLGVFFYRTFYWKVFFFLSLSSPKGVYSFATFYKFFSVSNSFSSSIFNLLKLMVIFSVFLPPLELDPPESSRKTFALLSLTFSFVFGLGVY